MAIELYVKLPILIMFIIKQLKIELIYQEQSLEGLVDKRTGNYRLSIEEGINKEILKLNKIIKKQKRELKKAKMREEILKKWTAFLNTENKKKEL